jgi:hypothetical protein
LLRHADPLSGTLRASATSIAANTSSDLRQIQRALRVLEDGGYISRLKNRPGQKGDYLIQINKYETIDGRTVSCESAQPSTSPSTKSLNTHKKPAMNPSNTYIGTELSNESESVTAESITGKESVCATDENASRTEEISDAEGTKNPSDDETVEGHIYNDISSNEILDKDVDNENKEEINNTCGEQSKEDLECTQLFRNTFTVITGEMERAFREDLRKFGASRLKNALTATLRKPIRSYRYTRKVVQDALPMSAGETVRTPSQIYEDTFHRLRANDARRFDEKLGKVPGLLLERVCRKKLKGYRELLKERGRWRPGPEPEDLRSACERECNDCLRQKENVPCAEHCPFRR